MIQFVAVLVSNSDKAALTVGNIVLQSQNFYLTLQEISASHRSMLGVESSEVPILEDMVGASLVKNEFSGIIDEYKGKPIVDRMIYNELTRSTIQLFDNCQRVPQDVRLSSREGFEKAPEA